MKWKFHILGIGVAILLGGCATKSPAPYIHPAFTNQRIRFQKIDFIKKGSHSLQMTGLGSALINGGGTIFTRMNRDAPFPYIELVARTTDSSLLDTCYKF